MTGVILAGGYGTRLMPLTKDTPKPMVKIIDKPILEYTVALLKKHGIKDIVMTLGYLPEKITDHFGDGSDYGVNITYSCENEPLGTAGSVKKTLKYLDEEVVIISGDCYTEIDISRAIRFHREKKSPFTVICQPHPDPSQYGVLEVDFDGKVTSFVEKPDMKKPALINTGIYIVDKDILRDIPEGKYDFGKQLIPSLVGKIFAITDFSYWSDIGTLATFYSTNAYLSNVLV